jgi:hypothetical protein
MSEPNEERRRSGGNLDVPEPGSKWVFGAFWALLFLATFMVAGPGAGFHALLLGCAGLLLLVFPPVVPLPRLWWILAALFGIAGMAAFLPADWFAMPAWRRQLESLGVQTGPLVAIQSRQAAEMFALFAIMLVTGLWLAGHRAASSQVRLWAMAFTLGVAAYAIIARCLQNTPHAGYLATDAHFGFFPNHNHTATYLAMGAICGLGNVLQALRDKRFFVMAVALAGTGVCLWAVGGWSVSRSGVVLVAIGGLVWLPMLGRRYLGKHGLWILGLIGLTVTGLFFITESRVKDRLAKIVEQTSTLIIPQEAATPGKGKLALESFQDLDFRIPIARDTIGLIRDFPWTGIGAGQYFHVFPQYRNLTAVANDSDCYHPESDWLWMAAETGIPATLALLALVVLAFKKSWLAILNGRDRALRSACLAAALLVPVHGLFDVPGHRITLAWSAALLFALSLHAPPEGAAPPPQKAWPFRLAALALLLAAALLIRAQWGGGAQPALNTAPHTLERAQRLYQEDQSLQLAAAAKGQTYQPDPAQDRLEKALVLLDQARSVAPLDRGILRYQRFLAFHFDDKYALIDRTCAIERALDPTWVVGPLQQAQAWAPVDPQRCAALWSEALRRADQLDRLQQPGTRTSRDQTIQRIRQLAKEKPNLEKLLPAPE